MTCNTSPSRRETLALAAAAAVSGAWGPPDPRFVTRDSLHLRRSGRPYRFVGTNVWYGAWLGAEGPTGDRARLRRDLDALKADGVTNIRAAAGAEESPLRNSVKPTFSDRGAVNETLMRGLDVFLAELARREMTAVLYLTNFWEWSGGMMTRLSWANGGRYVDMNDPAHPWPAFPDMAAGFYGNAEAVAGYHAWVRTVVTRRNTVTGRLYADDPTIMAWQLANEPRPGGSEAVIAASRDAFVAWIGGTARLIKSLDPNHLVSTGSEGLMGVNGDRGLFVEAHASEAIDYLTAHVWPANWKWLDVADMAGTDVWAREKAAAYVADHVALARELNKPLVVEEFGYPRNGNLYTPDTATTLRDGFYADVHAAVLADARAGGPLAGLNFWAWNGEGRTAHGDFRFSDGDSAFLGDPPHEPQGWYGVFDSDQATRAVVRSHARALSRL